MEDLRPLDLEEGLKKSAGSTGRPLMERLGAARVNVRSMYWCRRPGQYKETRGRGPALAEGTGEKTNIVDNGLNLVAQLVLAAVALGRERGVQVLGGRGADVCDEKGEIFGGRELDAALAVLTVVHGVEEGLFSGSFLLQVGEPMSPNVFVEEDGGFANVGGGCGATAVRRGWADVGGGALTALTGRWLMAKP